MNLRDYGYEDSTKYVTEPPQIIGVVLDETCPNCKGKSVFQIQVSVQHPALHHPMMPNGNKQIGTYLGCAACPWASPMAMRAK